MKKLFTFLGAMTCAAALLLPFDASAQTKKKAVYSYGDAMGAVTTDSWSGYGHNFYNKEGKSIRSVSLARSTDGQHININSKTVFIYDENGRITESISYQAQATSPDNVDNEFTFKPNNRNVNVYYDDGKLKATYQQGWSKSKEDWNATYLTQYREYTYNDDGSKATEKYWINWMESIKDKPSRVTTFEYDANGRLVKAVSTGQYENNCYDTEYSYDAQGRLIHTISTYTKPDGSHFGEMKEEQEWEYDGDFLVYVTSEKDNGTGLTRTYYERIDGDPNNYYEYKQSWKEETQEWVAGSVGGTYKKHVKQDYSTMAGLVPELHVYASAENPQDYNINFTLPTISAENYIVKVYRDGNELKSYTKEELADIYDGTKYSFSDTGLKSGEHEYFAQIILVDPNKTEEYYTEGYISDIATVETVIDYPKVQDFKIKGYTLKKTWVEPSTDPDTGEHYEGYWNEDYRLQLEWTPLTQEQVESYNFERYQVFFKSQAGNTPGDSFTELNTSEALVEWLPRYTEVWLSTKFGEDYVETEHITINLDELENLSDVDPIPAYGVVYYGGYTPAFVKVDLTKPAEAPEVVYNIWDDSQADWGTIFGGVTVDDTYYAFYEDSYEDGICFGAFNMSGKKYAAIGEPYLDGAEASFSDMLYDIASDKLYAVAPLENASELYSIDRTSGKATKTDIQLPAYTLYIAYGENGNAYAMAAETDGFQLYTVDLNAGTYAKVEGITVSGTQNKWSSLLCMGNTLYFNLNKKFYTINLEKNTVVANDDFKNGLSGLTTKKSSALPENGFMLTETAHMLSAEKGAEGSTYYYYNGFNQPERKSEFNADEKLVKYTKHFHNEAGLLTSTEVCEPATDAYGIESMQPTLTSTYSYNEAGLLSEKKNSDDSWERYTYTEDGLILTEAYGKGESTERTITYEYEDDYYKGMPYMATSTSETVEDYNYIVMFQYDELGNKIVEARAKDMLSFGYTAIETWEYFPNSNLVSAHNICSTTEVDDQGNPVVLHSTRYTMVDNKPNHLTSQEFEGENPVEGTAKELIYADLTNTANKSYIQITPSIVEGSANDVTIEFSLPSMAYSEPYTIDFFRDGVNVGKLTAGELSGMSDYAFTDTKVPNGKHEYFVRANAFDVDDEVPLQISPISELTLATELPAVSNIASVKQGEDGVVTIGWTNPEYPADYGFKGNHLFLLNGETPTAAGVVTDAAAAETEITVGDVTEFDLMIQTRYALGVANSETANIKLVGIDNVNAAGFDVKVADKTVIASEAAVISVFDMNGMRVATANADRLDLNDLNGAYIITAENGDVVRILKVVL